MVFYEENKLIKISFFRIEIVKKKKKETIGIKHP